MPTYTTSIEISAPIGNVFTRVQDIASHGEWSADPLQIETVDADHYKSVATSKGKTITATIDVTERTPPTRFGFDVVDATGRWHHLFTLAPTPAGTRVTRAISGKLSVAQLALYWVVLVPIKRPNAMKALKKLRTLLESGG